jgi:ABC-type branched-subunit amino acid transport system ATPase component
VAPTIEARVLVKRFGKVLALDDLDFVALSGQITALLGPNGAVAGGKLLDQVVTRSGALAPVRGGSGAV